jgi:cyclophilin family peptidyl-prolyl cis-trans isomerase
VPRAEKRQRKKENARAARAEREAALKRRKRNRTIVTVASVAVVFVGLVLLINLITGDNGKKKVAADSTTTVSSPASTTTPTTASPAAYPAGCVSTVPKTSTKPTFKSAPPMTIDPAKKYVATFDTTCGKFEVTLNPKDAPKTVNSFVFLAKQGFYDGLTFHRVAKDFVIQGGDPKGDGTGGPGYNLPTEPPANGYKKGSVAMANSGPDTTGSQFFVTLTDQGAQGLGAAPPYLYSALGDVTKGMDVVDKLGSLYNKDQNPGDPSSQKTAVPLYMFKVTVAES